MQYLNELIAQIIHLHGFQVLWSWATTSKKITCPNI